MKLQQVKGFRSFAVLTVLTVFCAADSLHSARADGGSLVPDGIVSWWKAEGNANDSIGTNNGQLGTNVTYVPGYVGEGFSFDGTDGSGVIVGNPTNLQLQNFTIETWMKRNDTNLVTYHSFGYADFFAYGNEGYGFGIHNNGNLCLTKLTWDVTAVPTGIQDTNFHHVAVTKSGTSLVFYLDGVAYPDPTPYYSTFAFFTPASIGMRGDDQTASFLGIIDDLAIYSRPLSTDEIQSIYNAGRAGKSDSPTLPKITQQPSSLTIGLGTNATFSVAAIGHPAPTCQWQFNGVDIQGETNTTLFIQSATLASAGNYAVVASNVVGAVTSSNAVLAVIPPISITGQPQDQTLLAGSNATFTVQLDAAAGFQWYFNNVAIAGATNASLVLANVNTKQAGAYYVVAYDGYSYATSSNAILTVFTPPVIYGQPQDQHITDGGTAVFSVNGIGDPKAIASNSLALWLRADAGVETDSQGQVSAWRDQSGNQFDAVQSTSALRPVLSASSALFGQPVIHFNGVQTPSEGQYLHSTSNLNTGNGFTAFLVYQHGKRDVAVLEETPVLVGVPGFRYHCQSFYIWTNSMMGLSSWGNDFFSGFDIPTDKFRVWTERLNANRTVLEFFDTDGSSNFSASVSTSWISTPGAGYYIGGEGDYTRNFYGDIAEIIYFRGKLSDSDKTLMDNYLKLKYFQTSSASDLTYQWYFNGGLIPGATNSILTLTNASVAQVGSYSVVLSNQWGTLTSSNAVLTLNYPPAFASQLQDQTVIVGSNVTLSSVATGSDPISYQWLYNGIAIVGATNSTLQLTNIAVAVAGSYQIVAANAYGSVTNTANVVVSAPTIVIGSGEGVGATQISVPVQLITVGTENAVGFSIAFDSKLLSLVSVDPGANIGGATVFFNTNNASIGNIGVVLGMSAGTTFSAGTQEIARVTFQISPLVTNAVTVLSFANQPSACRVADVNARTIETVYIGGSYSISHIEVEGDVSPRPDGDLAVLVDDWVQVGRYVAGLDTITNASEFQRADCAPRETLGNGRLTITDWVQTGRYAAGLDPVTPAGGPTEPSTNSGNLRATRQLTGSTREVTLIPATQQSSVNAVLVELTASGDENAVGFSLNFDTSILRYSKTVLNVTSQGVLLNVNTNQAAAGKLGFGLALPVGKTFTAGVQQLVRIEFLPVSYVSNSTMIAFSDIPVWRELSDVNANSLATNFSSQAIQVMGLPLPTLSVSTQSTNITLTWPGSTTGFVLEATSAFGKGWSTVTAEQATNNGSISVTVPLSQQQQYYRLKKP